MSKRMAVVALGVALLTFRAAPAGVAVDASRQYDLGTGYTRILVDLVAQVAGETPGSIEATLSGPMLQHWVHSGLTPTPLLNTTDPAWPVVPDVDSHFLFTSGQVLQVVPFAENKGSGNPALGSSLSGTFGIVGATSARLPLVQLIVPYGQTVSLQGQVATIDTQNQTQQYAFQAGIHAAGAVGHGRVVQETFSAVPVGSLPAGWSGGFAVQTHTDAGGTAHRVLRASGTVPAEARANEAMESHVARLVPGGETVTALHFTSIPNGWGSSAADASLWIDLYNQTSGNQLRFAFAPNTGGQADFTVGWDFNNDGNRGLVGVVGAASGAGMSPANHNLPFEHQVILRRVVQPDGTLRSHVEVARRLPGSTYWLPLLNQVLPGEAFADHISGLAIGTDPGSPWRHDLADVRLLRTLQADITLDGAVNLNDAQVLVEFWGATGVGFAQGDITGDRRVDLDDAQILIEQWGRTWGEFSVLGTAAADATLVPEPATLALLAAGGCLLGLRRRRRA